MEDKISRDKNKIKVFSSLLIIVILVMGVSFAIFQNFARQSGTNNLGATNCFSVTFEGVNNAINLANDYPIPDSEGLERSPYTFKVTNNCNQYLTLSIGVETLSTSEIPSNLIKGVIVKNGVIPTSASILSSGKTMEAQNGGTAYELLTDGLAAKASKTYDLRLWFDESMTKEQGASKKYQGKVIVASSADVEKPRLLNEAILADNEVKTPITTPGAAISASSEALLASAEDDYGTSYYFRGAVTNNYVEFANKCWRIVRIGGDNTVKLILHNDNTANVSNPCSSANNSSTAAFAHYSGSTYTSEYNINYDDNAYVGFMYGTPGSSTYEATHANTNKSTILTNLETWYNNNLKTYESVIADNVFCNDKNISGSGLGYGKNTTDYMSYKRLLTNKTPSIKCNGDLSKITSKIGLITTDELVYAGYAASIEGTTNYLNENATEDWWSMSPYDFFGNISTTSVNSSSFIFELLAKDPSATDSSARLLYVSSIGRIYFNDVNSSNIAARPVISLKSSTIISNGTGTSENPYKVL